jgi:Protein of unknown function (DUF2591)
MKIKTNQLTGAALDWAVAKCEGVTVLPKMRGGCYVTLNKGETVLLCYSTDWAQGGPIIEREKTTLEWTGEDWMSYIRHDEEFFGPTPLIAAMRCYVASKLGDEVEIPEELK